MRKWQQTWNCAHIWTDSDEPRTAARSLAAFLLEKRDRPQNEDVFEYIDELADEFYAIANDESASLNDFDCALNMLYDFCDDNSIWVRPA